MMRTITNPADLAQYRLRYARQSAAGAAVVTVRAKKGEAIAYIWTDDKGRPRALAWLGRATNPYSGAAHVGGPYWFSSPDKRAAWLARLFACAASKAERVAKDRAEVAAARAAGHKLKVGSILRSSWGYDQTNIDYYQVTKLVGRTMVEARKIAAQSEDTGHMSGVCVPDVGAFTGAAKRYRVSRGGDSIAVHSFASAYLQEPVTVAPGVAVYKPSSWTAYA